MKLNEGKKKIFFMTRNGIPRNQTECWSGGVLGRWSNLATHHHVRRSLGEGGATPMSAVLSAVLSAEGPAKAEASVKPDLPVHYLSTTCPATCSNPG
jgi:hypothetical protein